MGTESAAGARQPAPNEMETILDGVFHELTLRRESPNDTVVSERVKIRKISIQKMDLLGRVWGRLVPEVACYTDRPVEWVEKLSDESFEVALTEGRRLNFPSFEKWFKWQSQTAAALGNTDLLTNAVNLAVIESVRQGNPEAPASPKS